MIGKRDYIDCAAVGIARALFGEEESVRPRRAVQISLEGISYTRGAIYASVILTHPGNTSPGYAKALYLGQGSEIREF